MKYAKITLFLTTLIISVLALQPETGVYGREGVGPRKGGREAYAPRQFIVKLKPSVDFRSFTISAIGTLKTGISSLDRKNERFKVTSGEPVFKGKAKTAKGKKLEKELGLDRIFLFRTAGDIDVSAVVEAYKTDPNVEYAEPNGIQYAQETIPNDPYFPNYQWGLKNYYNPDFPVVIPTGRTDYTKHIPKEGADIDATLAWDKFKGGCVIAVVDGGVDWDHPDLSSKIWMNAKEFYPPQRPEWGKPGVDDDGNGFIDDQIGWDFANSDSNPMDDNGHGTNVAGIAASATNNGKGVAGVDWWARIMPVKVLNWGDGTIDNISKGIKYAADNGAKIINMSFGGYDDYQTERNAITYAYNLGKVLVAASGNDDKTPVMYPARYSQVLAVGATDTDDTRVVKTNNDSWNWGSNYGPELDVVAPGNWIYATTLNDTYGYWHGTSQAAPFVSGLASLIWGQNSSLTRDEVYSRIRNGADDLGASGFDNYYGYGRINANKSLSSVQGGGLYIPTDPAHFHLIAGEHSLTLDMEPDCTSNPVEVNISDAPAPAPPPGYNLVSTVWELLPSGINFLKPLTLTLSFSRAANIGLVDVFWYNPETEHWEKITEGRTVDELERKISVKIDHFSLFAVLESSAPSVGYTLPWILVTFMLLFGSGLYFLYQSFVLRRQTDERWVRSRGN